MGFRSLFTKGVAVTSASRTSQHSRKASSLPNKQLIVLDRQDHLKLIKK